jgi:hypothetical protein
MSEELRKAAEAALKVLERAEKYCNWPTRNTMLARDCANAASAIAAALAAPQELPPEMIEGGYIAMYRAVTGDTETPEHEIAETYRAMIGARK